MSRVIIYEKVSDGKRGVRIKQDKYGINIDITSNGWQWTSVPVDTVLCQMLHTALDVVLNEVPE